MKTICILLLSTLFSSVLDAGILSRDAYKHKWKKKKIKVCWANDSQTHLLSCFNQKKIRLKTKPLKNIDHYQSVIKNIITKEFSLSETGIEFVGWNKCPYQSHASEESDVVVQIKKNDFTRTAEISGDSDSGRGCYRYASYFRDKSSMVSFVRIFMPNIIDASNKLPLEDSIRWVALHEFLHAAGVAHEDEGKRKQLRTRGLIPVSSYDKRSVMSYRSFYKGILKSGIGSSNISLSAGDIHSMRCLYIYSKKERKTHCYKNFNLKTSEI